MVSAEQKAARACGLRCGVSEQERERVVVRRGLLKGGGVGGALLHAKGEGREGGDRER